MFYLTTCHVVFGFKQINKSSEDQRSGGSWQLDHRARLVIGQRSCAPAEPSFRDPLAVRIAIRDHKLFYYSRVSTDEFNIIFIDIFIIMDVNH